MYLAMPAIRDNKGRKMYPLCVAVPMGFGPSSGFAQAITDHVTDAAQLPASQRVKYASVMPRRLPVWGSIVDDLWALEQEDETDRGVPNVDVQNWMQQAEGQWERLNLPLHPGKIVNHEPGVEFQGTTLHPSQHWLGVST